MKKLLLAVTIAYSLSGCNTIMWTMGMPEADFKKQSKQIKVVEMTPKGNVYAFQTTDNGLIYFYFIDNKLVQIDHGTRRPDVLIQNQYK